MDKLPKALSSPSPKTAEPPPDALTEDVVHELEDLASFYRDQKPKTEEERQAALTTYHGALDKFENHEIKHLYDEGRVPTFESMGRAAEIASKALKDTGDAEALTIAKLLDGRVNNIKGWARKYIVALLKFRRAKTMHGRMTNEETIQMLEQSDVDRRRIHNALLESLSVLTTMVEKGEEYADYGEKIAEWSPSDILPRDAAKKPLVFSPAAIKNRDLIRDWSIVADRIEEINKIVQAEAA